MIIFYAFSQTLWYKYIFLFHIHSFLLLLLFSQSKWFNNKMKNYHNKVQNSYWGKWCKCHCSKTDTCSLPTSKGTVKGIKIDKIRQKSGSCRLLDQYSMLWQSSCYPEKFLKTEFCKILNTFINKIIFLYFYW